MAQGCVKIKLLNKKQEYPSECRSGSEKDEFLKYLPSNKPYTEYLHKYFQEQKPDCYTNKIGEDDLKEKIYFFRFNPDIKYQLSLAFYNKSNIDNFYRLFAKCVNDGAQHKMYPSDNDKKLNYDDAIIEIGKLVKNMGDNLPKHIQADQTIKNILTKHINSIEAMEIHLYSIFKDYLDNIKKNIDSSLDDNNNIKIIQKHHKLGDTIKEKKQYLKSISLQRRINEIQTLNNEIKELYETYTKQNEAYNKAGEEIEKSNIININFIENIKFLSDIVLIQKDILTNIPEEITNHDIFKEKMKYYNDNIVKLKYSDITEEHIKNMLPIECFVYFIYKCSIEKELKPNTIKDMLPTIWIAYKNMATTHNGFDDCFANINQADDILNNLLKMLKSSEKKEEEAKRLKIEQELLDAEKIEQKATKVKKKVNLLQKIEPVTDGSTASSNKGGSVNKKESKPVKNNQAHFLNCNDINAEPDNRNNATNNPSFNYNNLIDLLSFNIDQSNRNNEGSCFKESDDFLLQNIIHAINVGVIDSGAVGKYGLKTEKINIEGKQINFLRIKIPSRQSQEAQSLLVVPVQIDGLTYIKTPILNNTETHNNVAREKYLKSVVMQAKADILHDLGVNNNIQTQKNQLTKQNDFMKHW